MATPTIKKPTPLYDDPDFFAAYSKLPRSVEGLSAAAEWPRLRGFLPNLEGAHVLDLGCGFGWFCRWARDEGGAAAVCGMDNSVRMLARAYELTDEMEKTRDCDITYWRVDLEELDWPSCDEGTCDLIFSSLSLHYVKDLENLVWTVSRKLKPGGHFVFSVEHPIYTAPSNPQFVEVDVPGRDAAGTAETVESEVRKTRVWPLDGYQDEGLRTTDCFSEGLTKQHRTITTYINALLKEGLELEGFDEWCPTIEELEDVQDLIKWSHVFERPMFLLVKAKKKVPCTIPHF